MNEDFQVSWEVMGDKIMFEFAALIGKDSMSLSTNQGNLHTCRPTCTCPYCLPELAPGRPRICQCPCLCVRVLTGIELWFMQSQ